MVFKCKAGTTRIFRYRKVSGGKQRIGGCSKEGRIIRVKEIVTYKRGRIIRR